MYDLTSPELAALWEGHMRTGAWEAAWRVSDRLLLRRGHEHFGHPLPRHLQSVWTGESLAGKRVLVRCYHGLGDTVQFIRFIAPLRRRARNVIVWAQPQLLPLLDTVPGIDTLLPLHDGVPAAEYDVDIEIMELPFALRTTLDTLPAVVPYMGGNIGAARREANPRPHVGLVWQSGTWDPHRSVPLELIQQLTDIKEIRWKVLQRGPALAAWPAHRAEIPAITTLMEEAAQLRALDLLISVDTLSAHLAGALGVRTWTLLPASADWRWMDDREDTPWYPTMRLFRQPEPGDWKSVILRLRKQLELLLYPPCATRRRGVTGARTDLDINR